MEVQIEVGKGIQCDGIEIMFGNSISSVVKAVGEVDQSRRLPVMNGLHTVMNLMMKNSVLQSTRVRTGKLRQFSLR